MNIPNTNILPSKTLKVLTNGAKDHNFYGDPWPFQLTRPSLYSYKKNIYICLSFNSKLQTIFKKSSDADYEFIKSVSCRCKKVEILKTIMIKISKSV